MTYHTPQWGVANCDVIDTPLDLSPFPHLPFSVARNPLEDALTELGISLDGLRDLTTSVCEASSAKYRNQPSVRYFSVAGCGRLGPLPMAAPFLLLQYYIFARTGRPNDGLVTRIQRREAHSMAQRGLRIMAIRLDMLWTTS